MLWQLPDIKLAPDVIFTLFGVLPVTNTLLCTWITILVLSILFFFGTRSKAMIPSGMQNFVEWAVESLVNLVAGITGEKNAKKFFPLIGSFFLFIIVSNLLDIIPGVDTIGAIDTHAIQQLHTSTHPVFGFLLFGDISNKIIPWIRPATSDLNLTLALALITVITCQVAGMISLGGAEHIGRYLRFKALFTGGFSGFVEFFVGLLEIIGELSRVLSLSFRLFGNIFAGSTVLAVFAYLLPFVAAVIFIPFELFVGFIQALIFSLLSLVFLQIATTSHEAHEHAVPQEVVASA